MSTNCIRCVVKKRTGPDLLCDDCRQSSVSLIPHPTTKKLYAERDIETQGEFYLRHLAAMTTEGLHSKSDIAAELAHRDQRIAELEAHLTLPPELAEIAIVYKVEGDWINGPSFPIKRESVTPEQFALMAELLNVAYAAGHFEPAAADRGVGGDRFAASEVLETERQERNGAGLSNHARHGGLDY